VTRSGRDVGVRKEVVRYDALVPALVLTVIGDDRVGLVEALADTVSTHGGNWEHSQMAELAGKFAGIVVVTVPADRATDLTGALRALDGMLEVSVHPGRDAADQRSWPQLTLDLIGNDHPGIVHEVSAVLSRHGLSIETITTETRDAPMAGGMIFEAHVVARLPPSSDPAAVRADLEKLATELMVDISAGEK
jgi:glycine cleavage system regulatory protein